MGNKWAGIEKEYADVLGRYTRFCRRVWECTVSIREGDVKTYAWIAARMGNPRAVRAVGRALNRNPLPVIIPCHRVIRKDGFLGGFSRGVRVKKKLLEKEFISRGNGFYIETYKRDDALLYRVRSKRDSEKDEG